MKSNKSDLKAIETRYAGCRFRSRLEARWAVFFDHLGIAWEYEPEGFELPHGRYLPDFWLPGFDAWFEIKGVEPVLFSREIELAADLATATRKIVFTAWGSMPRSVRGDGRSDERRGIDYVEFSDHPDCPLSGDYDYAFCVCPCCDEIGFQYEARSERIHDRRSPDKIYTGDHPRILAAYTAARSARFEHGENG